MLETSTATVASLYNMTFVLACGEATSETGCTVHDVTRGPYTCACSRYEVNDTKTRFPHPLIIAICAFCLVMCCVIVVAMVMARGKPSFPASYSNQRGRGVDNGQYLMLQHFVVYIQHVHRQPTFFKNS